MQIKKPPFPPFIIAFKQKIINNQVLEKLISFKHIIYMLIGYINNKVIMQYLNYLIKYFKAKPKKL